MTFFFGLFSSFFLTPFILFILSIVFLASFGKSIGVRKIYVNLLLKIFEYGRVNIESAKNLNRIIEVDETDENNDKENAAIETKENGGSKIEITTSYANGGIPQANGNSVITRNTLILVPDAEFNQNKENKEAKPKGTTGEATDSSVEKPEQIYEFDLANCLDYIKAGMEAIIEDDVTSRFEAEELKNWNLLTRTNRRYEFISWRLTVIWVCGFFVRWCILMPFRVFICFIGVGWCVFSFAIVGLIPYRPLRRWANDEAFKISFRLITRSISGLVKFHNPQFRPKNCGFCVANHTSPIDISILSTDCSYSLIGQRHGGFLGVLQRALARASPHIWFERAEAKDRSAVAQRLKQHVSDPNNPPILIFPEGTCINNTSVMQFKKGSFEVGGVIYPVAIKYDPRFGDAFWNSSEYSMMQYLFLMMTSWAIVCDVWYLPPMYMGADESAIDFANRVKSVIAKQGGLVDLMWDGQLKRMKPKSEWKAKQQEEFTKRLKGE